MKGIMNRKFIIDERSLISLIKAELKLVALESGGVDNWSYYSDSLNEYLEDLGYDEFDILAKDTLKQAILNGDYEVYNEE